MRCGAHALLASAIAFASLLRSDPVEALGMEVPLASCVAAAGADFAPYGGPTPPDWQIAGRLSCQRFAAAHLPSDCSSCALNGTICSSVASCSVQDIGSTYVGGGDRMPGTVLLTITGNLPGCTVTQDLGSRQIFNCSCPDFAGFGPDNRCYCLEGALWNPETRSCTFSCNQSITEGHCLPQKPGKDCAECPLRGDITAGTNPINVATGIKFQPESYYRSASRHGLSIAAVFASGTTLAGQPFRLGLFGRNRTSPFDRALRETSVPSVAHAFVVRPDGRRLDFRRVGSAYVADPDIADRLEREPSGWRYRVADGDLIEAYSPTGTLLFEEDRHGRRLKHTHADGSGGHVAGAGAFGYVAPACEAPQGWIYQVEGSGTPAPGFLPAGRLLCVTDHFGRQLHFQYDRAGRVTRMTDPAGGIYRFRYDGPSGGCSGELQDFACVAGNLTSVEFPDGKSRVYHYNELDKVNGGAACAGRPPFSPGRAHLPNHLTGLVDENGERFASWTYDCEGRATSSEHADGAGRVTVAYDTPASGQSTVTDARKDRVYSFSASHGVSRNTALSHPVPGRSGAARHGYDENGNIASRVDWNGNRSNHGYDLARNLETMRTEGLTASGDPTPQTRTISTEWHPVFRLPQRIAEPLRITALGYDPDGGLCGARGALCSRSIQPTSDPTGADGFSGPPAGRPRTWSYAYDANGALLAADGPRTDVADITTYAYYAADHSDAAKRGNLATIRNAAGHVTSFTAYNLHGQPITIVDPNGMTIELGYDQRQRLVSRDAGGEVTRYDYDGAGQLTRLTLPDGSRLKYEYDAARRLRAVEDNLRNRIVYDVDELGGRRQELVYDPAGQLAQRKHRMFDTLGRLFRELGAHDQTTEFGYDDQGNVTQVKDPLERITSNHYDALNRLERIVDAARGVTRYAYNGLDALIQVSDPRQLVTGYRFDGLGDLARQDSPDTGTTLNAYDEGGNLFMQTDAKQQVTTYAYDALNRVASIRFHDGSLQEYSHDHGPNAVGRLSAITERDHDGAVTSVIEYSYDLHGRIRAEARTLGGVRYRVGYAYVGGRLAGVSYPSGLELVYSLDGLGRVSGIVASKDGESQVVVQDVVYHPFGAVKGYTLGNGQAYSRSIDLDGRVASYTLGMQTFGIGYDAAGRIEFIADLANAANVNTYSYDELDRISAAVTPGTPFAYSYDAVGNRRSRTVGSVKEAYEYGASSNRIASVTPENGPPRVFRFDDNGSTVSDGNNEYDYDARGRMFRARGAAGSTTYQVNALGQRARKTGASSDTVFHYDTSGRLIGESEPGGAFLREYLYLGDIPVGIVQ
jgi:YD repeat-containing protein